MALLPAVKTDMKKLNLYTGFFILLAILICACTPSGSTHTSSAPTTSRTSTPFLTNTATNPYTRTPTPVLTQEISTLPSVTPIPLITPPKPTITMSYTQTTTTEKVRYEQIDVAESFPSNNEFKGTLILSGYYNFGPFTTPEKDLNSDSYLLDLNTGIKNVVAEKNDTFWSYDVSPDHRWLVYDTKSDLVIATADWAENIKIPLENDWMASEWLNNDTLAIRKNIGNGNIDKQRGSAGESSLLLLNPFTGMRKEILPDFPDIWSADPCWRIGCLLSSPGITFILYPVMWDKQPFVLWDLQAGKEIARLPYGDMPAWSPDSKLIAMVRNSGSGDEFYIASQNGQMTRLTLMTTSYPDVSIAAYSWSPDSRSIAFWMARDRGLPYHLTTVDTQTGLVQEYSIQADFSPGAPYPDYIVVTNSIAPVWSPNGKQLLVDSFDPEKNLRSVIIVDMEKDLAVKVVDNMIPVGWMVNEP